MSNEVAAAQQPPPQQQQWPWAQWLSQATRMLILYSAISWLWKGIPNSQPTQTNGVITHSQCIWPPQTEYNLYVYVSERPHVDTLKQLQLVYQRPGLRLNDWNIDIHESVNVTLSAVRKIIYQRFIVVYTAVLLSRRCKIMVRCLPMSIWLERCRLMPKMVIYFT